MFYEKDLKVFFKEFAIDIYLVNGKSFRALFDDNTNFVDRNDYILSNDKPQLTVSKIDVDKYNLKQDDIVFVNDIEYKISSVKNEIGISIIELLEV